MKSRTISSLLFLLATLPIFAQANAQKIGQWLVLGPAPILANGEALPAGDDAAMEYEFLPVRRLRPEAGAKALWSTQQQLAWRADAARFTGAAGRQVVYLAVYLESRRWLQAELAVEAAFPLRIYLDGAELSPAASGGKDAGKNNYPLTMANGKHLLLVKGILPSGAGASHALQASLEKQARFRRRSRRGFPGRGPPHRHGRRAEHGEHQRCLSGPGRKPGGGGPEPASCAARSGNEQLAGDPGYGKRRPGVHFAGIWRSSAISSG